MSTLFTPMAHLRTELRVYERRKLTMADQGRHVVMQSYIKELVQSPGINGVAIPVEGVIFPDLR